jgi:hypothetical protein
MRKSEGLSNPASCMNPARPAEMTFVLLGRDAAAPHTIREWIKKRIELGKNKPEEWQIREAEACAQSMERDNPK